MVLQIQKQDIIKVSRASAENERIQVVATNPNGKKHSASKNETFSI